LGETQATLLVQSMPAHTHSLPPPDGATGTNGGGQPRNNVKPSLAVTYVIVPAGIFPVQGGAPIPEPFLGEIMLHANASTPQAADLVAGQILAINQNQALFAVLGTNYGGNGQTTFALPNLQSRVPVGIGQGQMSLWSLGQQTGFESVTMTQKGVSQ
jgi:microcystin-dependent protein